MPLPLPRRIRTNRTSDKHLEHARDQAPPQETHALSSKPNAPTVDDSQNTADEVQELEEAALEFLQKHIRAFDSDRSSLASAYSRLATFSVQTQHPPDAPSATLLPRSHTKLPHPRGPTEKLKQGRLDIIAELLSLPDDRHFCVGRQASIDYDVTCLESTVGVLLVCYSENEGGWACDQRFVLRRKEWDKEDGSTEGLWPLIAVCHQMTFREKASR
ncbi:uncharacterized protein LAESUDRAFT_724991 [Laetiporus sulphureus 93-53]|uniref:Nuclear transport factor 2 domain-containing protein n=1 Tax=Laetiporus sulphureus 93-53 TaxID=1314785 RepID=A0A165EQ38_9APHY|nr:uncharacterized protein LAESUDRAFT_724991 [Laetiporus sulphureus 93-53]KZT07532.1 hypothetical protein LAESUDRAFT_724991 [Laetiporus sulphureus 93-53]